MVPPYSLTFGPFSLHFPQRALSKDGEPVRLGSRALDILVVLVESAGQLRGRRRRPPRAYVGFT
jgi:DNA-binding winged helix-turn-helix (wHTH) protein